MKYFLLILTLIFPAHAAALPAGTGAWIGVYTFDEESWDEDRARTSYWFRLEVEEVDGKLTGIYADGVNGATTRRFRLAIETADRRARFFFERSLPRVEGGGESCPEDEFAAGELLFELEETTVDANGAAISTVWQKMNLAAQTETGGSGPKTVFFRKVRLDDK